jgi:RNA polymerase sigma-70 factor, ECF subfamily
VKQALEETLKLLAQAYSRESMEPNPPQKKPQVPLPLTDAELFHALQTRQPKALSILYERYGSLVYGVALKILQNASEAEDLTQEIFLALWRHANYNPEHGYFIRYLITMTRSRSIDKLRSRGRNVKLLDRWRQTVTAESPSSTPFEQACLTERSQHVREALSQLTQNQRQVLEMAYDSGQSQSEIAQQLDIPLGTVKTYTRQGLLKLKQILRDSIG